MVRPGLRRCAEAESERPNGADVRWRIEHAQILRPSDYHWFKDLPIIASMQPSHAIGDLHFAPARLGDATAGRGLRLAQPGRSWRHRGRRLGRPVERGAPLIEFYAAVARRDLEGFQGPDWRPNEAVDRATALKMFTLWPAYASFREAELGTIEVGKRADFTAFRRRPDDRPLRRHPAGPRHPDRRRRQGGLSAFGRQNISNSQTVTVESSTFQVSDEISNPRASHGPPSL
jgi:predicted amidohydrolase YtcJ